MKQRSYNRSASFRHSAGNVLGLYSYKIHNRRQPHRLKTKPHRVSDGIRAASLGFVPTDGGVILRGSTAAPGKRPQPLDCLQTCRFPSLSEIDLQIVLSNSLRGRLSFSPARGEKCLLSAKAILGWHYRPEPRHTKPAGRRGTWTSMLKEPDFSVSHVRQEAKRSFGRS